MITQNRNEITAVRENNAKMVALNQRDAQTKWGQLEVFMTQWRRIDALTTEPGPFIWRTSYARAIWFYVSIKASRRLPCRLRARIDAAVGAHHRTQISRFGAVPAPFSRGAVKIG